MSDFNDQSTVEGSLASELRPLSSIDGGGNQSFKMREKEMIESPV